MGGHDSWGGSGERIDDEDVRDAENEQRVAQRDVGEEPDAQSELQCILIIEQVFLFDQICEFLQELLFVLAGVALHLFELRGMPCLCGTRALQVGEEVFMLGEKVPELVRVKLCDHRGSLSVRAMEH